MKLLNFCNTTVFITIVYELLTSCQAHLCPSKAPTCIVQTTSGYIQGICTPLFNQYLSIPYAKPPTSELRLNDPVEFFGSGLIDGTRLPKFCPQAGVQDYSSEDCLYLNVYRQSKSLKYAPVLFWVHGGSNIQGGSADPIFNGTEFVKRQPVILVTFNYRLGILGFYDSHDSPSGTNFAIKDAVLALQWVKRNIARFGGDPSNVTLFGNSSGGGLIRALISSKQSGLFVRAILQSDPQHFGFNLPSISQSVIGEFIKNSLGCASTSCVKQKSLEEILSTQDLLYESLNSLKTVQDLNSVYPFGPNVDGRMIQHSAWRPSNSVDIIMGFTRNESAAMIAQVAPGSIPFIYFPDVLSSFIGVDGTNKLLNSSKSSSSLFTDLIRKPDGTRLQLEQIATDFYWACPNQLNARALIYDNRRKVYMYQLVEGIQHPDNQGVELCENAVCHMDDLLATFGTYNPSQVTSQQISLSHEIQDRWAAFAKSGSPNIPHYKTWPEVTAKSVANHNLNILELGGGDSTTSSVDQARCFYIDRL